MLEQGSNASSAKTYENHSTELAGDPPSLALDRHPEDVQEMRPVSRRSSDRRMPLRLGVERREPTCSAHQRAILGWSRAALVRPSNACLRESRRGDDAYQGGEPACRSVRDSSISSRQLQSGSSAVGKPPMTRATKTLSPLGFRHQGKLPRQARINGLCPAMVVERDKRVIERQAVYRARRWCFGVVLAVTRLSKRTKGLSENIA